MDDVIKAELEPEARPLTLHIEKVAQVSLAISMKRIADFLCGHCDREGIDHLDFVQYLGRELSRSG
jgi:hypothetical protein